ncbi:MAG: hypothetical protein DMG57_32615 [Acidobacteria bacterium]|nr:MAG: hypothetical protein DMG57_32615 [Acidobacteriota bacterium]
MVTKVMTWLSVAVLIIAVFSRSNVRDLGIGGLMIFAEAIVVLVRAVRLRKHYWMIGLAAVAVLFILFVAPVSSTLIMGLELACTLAFVASLFALRPQPILSIVSITDRTPGSESL